MIFVVGHQKPDLDSIVSAYAWAEFLTKTGTPATPKIASEKVGAAARWLFEKYDLELPEFIPDVSGQEIFLVDHTEPSQSPVGIADAQVRGVLDHHPVAEGVDYENLTVEMIGATATLVAEKFLKSEVELRPALAGILLGAILDDTIIFRSPTVTPRDKEVALKLAKIAGVKNLQHFGVDIFTAKSNWNEMTEAEMLEADAKEWEQDDKLIYCAAMETVDGQALMARSRAILEALRAKKQHGGYFLTLALVVDILEQQSWVIVEPEQAAVVEAILDGAVSEEGVLAVPSVLSRKKQVQKPLLDYLASH